MSRQKDRKPAPGQAEFDFERPMRRLWIQEIQIPSFHYVNSRGRRVYVNRTATMKDCLKVIESKCGQTPDKGWYLFVDEIAGGMSKDKRTASRAIADCRGGGLLEVQTSCLGHIRSHYQIIWKKIVEIIKGNPETARYAADIQVAEATHGSGEITHDKSPATHDKLTLTHDKLSSTHDKSSWGHADRTIDSRARGLNHDSLPNKKPSWPHGKPNGYAGWPFKVELPHLKHSEAIDRLWKAAIERRDVVLDPTLDRVRFFALASFVARLAGLGEIANPGGYFHAQLVRKDDTGQVLSPNWLGEPIDFEKARKAVAYVDCQQRETPADRAAREGRRHG